MIEAIHHGIIPYLPFYLTLLYNLCQRLEVGAAQKQAENTRPLPYDATPIVMTIVVRF